MSRHKRITNSNLIFFKEKIMARNFLVVLFVCLMAFSAWAEEKKLHSDEVLVTATRSEKVAKEVPMTLSVVTQDEITRKGSSSVADLLRDVPGVQITSTGSAGIFRLNLRGESGSRSLVMVDGIKISEQKSMDGAALLIDINSIERIEVIKGPASVLYGSEAIGGAINVITKKGGKKKLQGTLSSQYNSGTDGVDASLSIYGNYEGFYYRAEGTRSDHNERRDNDNDKINNTKYDNRNVRVLVGYENDKFDIGFEHSDYHSDNEVRTGIENDPAFSLNMDLPEWNRKKTSAYFELKNINKLVSKIKLDVYRQVTFKEFQNNMSMTRQMGPVSMTMNSYSTTENDLETTGLNAQMDLNIADTNLMIVGFEYMKDDLEVDDTKMPFGANTFSYYSSEAEQSSKSFFIHDEQMLGENFILSAGLRHTSTDTELKDSDNPAYEEGDSDNNSTVGSIALVYNGVKNTALRALYSRGYRNPNLQQLYMGTTHGGSTPTYSNSDLDSETSDNFEIGARFDNRVFDLDVALFHNRAKDYITTRSTTINNAPARIFTNVDKATTKGVELTVGYNIADFRPYINGTYLHRKYEAENFSTTKNGMPDYFGRIGLQYQKNFEKSFISADFYVRHAAEAEEELSSGDVEKTDGYSTCNLNINYGYTFENGRRMILTAEALNINNEDYELALSPLKEPGRHFIVKASLDF
jgi:hemoglobin/transferrin/lactoferrin receptor protein